MALQQHGCGAQIAQNSYDVDIPGARLMMITNSVGSGVQSKDHRGVLEKSTQFWICVLLPPWLSMSAQSHVPHCINFVQLTTHCHCVCKAVHCILSISAYSTQQDLTVCTINSKHFIANFVRRAGHCMLSLVRAEHRVLRAVTVCEEH